MNTIIISPSAADPNKQQPFTAPSLTFLQEATKESLNSLAMALFPNATTNTVYVLFGCTNTGTGTSYIIGAGAVYYNGEVFTVPAATFTSAGGQTAVANISITNPSPDPILLKDGTTVSVHNVRQVVIASAASASGITDYINFIGKSTKKIDSVTSGNLTSSELVLHNIIPSQFNISNLSVLLSGSFGVNPGSPTPTQIILRLYNNATVTGHAAGTLGGTLVGSPIAIKTVPFNVGVAGITDTVGALAYIFNYTGGNNVTITVEASVLTSTPAIQYSSDFMVL